VPHPPDSKQFEKDYLKRTGIADWDRTKPFAPPGRDTVDESLALIHAFAVALRCLAPTPADLILDLGAGACWCSDWLERLNLRAVSIDISHDMLALGRERLRDGSRLVAGDMEHLPFRTGTFDKAICLNALHHVPDIPAALAEIEDEGGGCWCQAPQRDGEIVDERDALVDRVAPGRREGLRAVPVGDAGALQVVLLELLRVRRMRHGQTVTQRLAAYRGVWIQLYSRLP
jgi:SAM-dependent methyltransferase